MIITFTDQNRRPLEMEGKVDLRVQIEMTRYSIKPRTRIYVKGNRFLSLTGNLFNKYEKQVLNTATETFVDALKTGSKKSIA